MQLLPNYVDLLGRPVSASASTPSSASASSGIALPSTLQTASFATRFAAVSSLHKLMRALAGATTQADAGINKKNAAGHASAAYPSSLFTAAVSRGSPGDDTRLQLEPLAATLLPLLFGCWLECGPSDPASQSQIQKLECMEVVLEVIEAVLLLLETTSGLQRKIDFLAQYYKDMQRYFAVYFPFHAETVAAQRDKRVCHIKHLA